MASYAFLACATLLSLAAWGAEPSVAPSPLLGAMKAELDHSMGALKGEPTPPFFLSYLVTDSHHFHVSARFGALFVSSETRNRHLDLDVRVGSPLLDNTHPLRSAGGFQLPFLGGAGFGSIALEDDPGALRSDLWWSTDQAYKRAVEQLGKVKSNMSVNVVEEDPSPDFSAAPRVEEILPAEDLSLDRKAWEGKLRLYSLAFAKDGTLEGGTATLEAQARTVSYVNTEGTLLQLPDLSTRLFITAQVRAKDGMVLTRYANFFARRPEGLPSDDEVLARVAELIKELHALKEAPVTDPYAGPAILSGRAASVFFHEVLGHRVEGHRQKGVNNGQTLKAMVGQKLLPEAFSVCSDPTLAAYGAVPLAGHYRFDDEGVRARKVPLIEQGVLKGFLMGRMPIAGFPLSNGHGRKAPGLAAVSRQASLVVTSAAPVTRADLKKMLLELVHQQGKPYGLFIDDIEGGFTTTGRVAPNAFNVRPLMVYRVYPDGKEELVRGVDFIGTPLQAFAKVVAADDDPQVFNGICGAESGPVPVSAISPGILLSQIEVQKKEKNQGIPPILPPPSQR